MPVDRQLLERFLTKRQAPPWRCPRCAEGHLRLIPESVVEESDADTKRVSGWEGFDFDQVKSRFIAMTRCDNDACKEIAVLAGRGMVDYQVSDDGDGGAYIDLFIPQYFWPSPRLIVLPPQSPQSVVEALERAFVAIWGDASAASNHIRNAVELLLDHLNIPKTVVKRHKRARLPLHDRITKLERRSKQTYDYLLAIKWLGNAGVHPGDFTQSDALDALDILEEVLINLFSGHPQAVRHLVARVNARRAPAKKRIAVRAAKSRAKSKGRITAS